MRGALTPQLLWFGVRYPEPTGYYGSLGLPSDIPTLTEWGPIIFGVVLVGFITWVFLKRRKAVVSVQ